MNERERFDAKVDRRGPDECWPWLGTRDSHGYGLFRVDGRWTRASRTALRLAGRAVAEGLFALHRCDNPPCVNPRHLWEGTKADNTMDAYVKGRLGLIRPVGESHPSARLTTADVIAIRDRHQAGETRSGLARLFGITHQSIGAIVDRRSWKHVR